MLVLPEMREEFGELRVRGRQVAQGDVEDEPLVREALQGDRERFAVIGRPRLQAIERPQVRQGFGFDYGDCGTYRGGVGPLPVCELILIERVKLACAVSDCPRQAMLGNERCEDGLPNLE
ncbi:hypothetical protein [Methylobacterium sp. Leaf102]|uniref:hypothetical protein n=1 Tax=Methylobacterium sp. Leaf102 TaxID=1736253 RepID=UPI000B01F8DB|nr:hypothetical protein [Methylobacterium sp. Leaf102]